MSAKTENLYNQYFIERNFERQDLFELISEKYQVQRALYPGSFVHISPSFVIPEVVYMDNDKTTKNFFRDEDVMGLILRRKIYPQTPKFEFHFADYRSGLNLKEESYDLLISQYAGFIGQYCKSYLKTGGLLLANNSHGDAGLAAIDDDYRLIAVFNLRDGKYKLSERNLGDYFIPKKDILPSRDYLMNLQKGIAYKKSADVYLFLKI